MNNDSLQTGTSSLTIDKVRGVFVLLSVAVAVGIAVAVGETLVVSFRQSFKWKVSQNVNKKLN